MKYLIALIPIFAACTSPNWQVQNQSQVRMSIQRIQNLESQQGQWERKIQDLQKAKPRDSAALSAALREKERVEIQIQEEKFRAENEMRGLQNDYQEQQQIEWRKTHPTQDRP